MMKAPKYIVKVSYYTFVCCVLFAFTLSSFANQLEGQYIDQTDSEKVTLLIESVGSNEILISEPKKTFIIQPITVSIIDKKVNDLGGMKICNYITSNKDVRFSEINGSITLSLFTKNKAFVGKKHLKK